MASLAPLLSSDNKLLRTPDGKVLTQLVSATLAVGGLVYREGCQNWNGGDLYHKADCHHINAEFIITNNPACRIEAWGGYARVFKYDTLLTLAECDTTAPSDVLCQTYFVLAYDKSKDRFACAIFTPDLANSTILMWFYGELDACSVAANWPTLNFNINACTNTDTFDPGATACLWQILKDSLSLGTVPTISDLALLPMAFDGGVTATLSCADQGTSANTTTCSPCTAGKCTGWWGGRVNRTTGAKSGWDGGGSPTFLGKTCLEPPYNNIDVWYPNDQADGFLGFTMPGDVADYCWFLYKHVSTTACATDGDCTSVSFSGSTPSLSTLPNDCGVCGDFVPKYTVTASGGTPACVFASRIKGEGTPSVSEVVGAGGASFGTGTFGTPYPGVQFDGYTDGSCGTLLVPQPSDVNYLNIVITQPTYGGGADGTLRIESQLGGNGVFVCHGTLEGLTWCCPDETIKIMKTATFVQNGTDDAWSGVTVTIELQNPPYDCEEFS